MRVLNLYAGVGGNRKLWQDVEVTAVELDERIAKVYQKLYPEDTVLVDDAHSFLLEAYDEFDFIWSSPPCPTHSRMMKATRHNLRCYPDMALYQEILFLKHFFKGKYVVENVVSYYDPLIEPQKIGRHYYWSNFDVGDYQEPMPKDFINMTSLNGKQKLHDWLDIHFDETIYLGTHDPAKILRNCVHPKEGLAIFQRAQHNNGAHYET